jgi:hypothetical protein
MKIIPMYIRASSGSVHPFPINLEMTTRRKVQGIFMYFTIVDNASHLFFKPDNPNALNLLIERLNQIGVSTKTFDSSWQDFVIYMESKPSTTVQQAIFNIEFAWDRFISEIKHFMIRGNEILNITLPDKEKRILKRLDKYSQREIIDYINKNIEVTNITEREIVSITELCLLRNLGVHKDWVIDNDYSKKTTTQYKKIGELRDVDFSEFQIYFSDWMNILGKISRPISEFYKDVHDPEFEL